MTLSEINYRLKISFGIFSEWKWTVMSQTGRSRVKMNGRESKRSQNERSMKLNWPVGTAKIIRRLKIKLDGLVKWTVQDHKVVGLNGEKWTAQRIKTGRSFQIKVDGPLEHHRELTGYKTFYDHLGIPGSKLQ